MLHVGDKFGLERQARFRDNSFVELDGAISFWKDRMAEALIAVHCGESGA